MKLVKFISTCLISTVYFNALGQGPILIQKQINNHLVMDGTKKPLERGWSLITPAEQKKGEVSLVKAEGINIKCLEGEAITFGVTQGTVPEFKPSNNYTIEVKAKIVKNNGRGLDLYVRDGKNVSRLICITHNRVIINGEKVPVATLNGKEFHTYRLAVEREERKMHIYIDGIYKSTSDLVLHGGKPLFSFGKGNVKSDTEIVINYITYDLTGAYAPNI
ncbi:hypothetical protein [Pedobacter nyackensis]|uniref:Alginate lyase n=1 Tax=Pedobacter nyackensis TaxID=475255 RepID=A0A1W2D156_9SPHI|nr:hypothetical protein [Pedobacter nyackensis]SMC91251.1 hypothetical protein SAMN04488101_105172 [Pedobacter nyackensis]